MNKEKPLKYFEILGESFFTNNTVSQLEAEWKEKYEQLQQQNEEKEQEFRIQVEEFNRDRENYAQEIETLNERIYQMENSFSWKITRPFRSISGE